jgi:hypothetical protein
LAFVVPVLVRKKCFALAFELDLRTPQHPGWHGGSRCTLPEMRCVRVKRDETPVMFVAAEGDPRVVAGAAQQAFSELESRLGPLRGRRFFGVFDPVSSEYLACVQTRDGDDSRALGLTETVIPGGAYLRATVTGEPPAVYARIAPTFDELEKHANPDSDRPLIEFYRRHDEIDLLVPVV